MSPDCIQESGCFDVNHELNQCTGVNVLDTSTVLEIGDKNKSNEKYCK
jgi:hypothetical protein